MVTQTISCTCNAYNQANPNSHEITCWLWDDEDFITGDACWDPEAQLLVSYYDDSVFDEEAEEQEREDDVFDYHEQLETVHDTRDILTVVLEKLHPGRDLKTLDDDGVSAYAQAATFVGPSVIAAFENISNQHELDDDELACIEAFGRELHVDMPADVPPYICTCSMETAWSIKEKVFSCDGCGVLKWNGPDGVWVPNYDRRLRELRMTLELEQYGCNHVDKKWACMDCNVAKWDAGIPWTYWNRDGQGTWVLESDLNKDTSRQVASNVTDMWEGTGFSTFTGKCRHYGETVTLADGTQIMCSSEHKRKLDATNKPDLGCYFYSGWKPDWLYLDLEWRDYGLPEIPFNQVLDAVGICLDAARKGRVVEIGCMGGHGRTGTFLAILALHAGTATPEEAIDFVHTQYCKEAIEGVEQEWYIAVHHAHLHDLEIPARPPKPCAYTTHMQMFDKGEECDPPCSDRDRDYKTWLNRIESALKIDWTKPLPIVVKQPAKVSAPTIGSISPKVYDYKTKSYVRLDWTLPLPDQEDGGWCSVFRHNVIWWRKDTCDCKFWERDEKSFKTQNLPQAYTPKPEHVKRREEAAAQAAAEAANAPRMIDGVTFEETRTWEKVDLAMWLTERSEAELATYVVWLNDDHKNSAAAK